MVEVMTEDAEAVLDHHAHQFRMSLKPLDQDQFSLVTRDSLHAEIRNLQLQQEKTGTLRNLSRIGMFLKGIDELEAALNAIEIPTAKVSQAMALIWGSARFLAKNTAPTDAAFDNVLDAYELLGEHLLKLSEYSDFFTAFADSQECLLNIYQDIQKFHLTAYNLFSLNQKLWQRLHKSVWRDLENTRKQIAQSLGSHARFIMRHAAEFRESTIGSNWTPDSGIDLSNLCDRADAFRRHRKSYRVALSRDLEKFTNDEEMRKAEQKRRVISWISAPTKNEVLHRTFQKARICANTGRWLFRSYSTVTDWMKGATEGDMKSDQLSESAIWLRGKRGYGKTILASLVVDELEGYKNLAEEAKLRREPIIPKDSKIYYFYCQEGDDELRSFFGVLRGILNQMVNQESYILPLCEDKMIQKGCGTLPDVDTAKSIIEVFFGYSSRQYLIIDGLDECEINEACDIAKFFNEQVHKCGAMARGQLRVMFLSQPMEELKSCMPADDASIELKSTDNRSDIEDYVTERIKEFSRQSERNISFNLSQADEEQIRKAVCRQSGDMFLYAHLAMEHLLQQPTKRELLRCVSRDMLPAELSMLYKTLLESIEIRIKAKTKSEKQWEIAKLLLGWLVCAKRPLKWHEMQSILSFEPDTDTVNLDHHRLRHHIRNYLGSLVHILDGGHIRLIHATARTHIFQYSKVAEKKVQFQLTTLCLQYLSLPCFTKDFNPSDRQEQARLGWFSFQDYACSQWHSHIDTVIRECREIFDDEDSSEVREFSSALTKFIDTHRQDLESVDHNNLRTEDIENFRGKRVFANLFFLWNHIFTHQKGSPEQRDKVGIKQIDEALQENRKELESFSLTHKAVNSDTIEDYYGANLYKCPRTRCSFFWVGYDNEAARKRHEQRHDRPFQCPLAGCNWAPNGFATSKDMERHKRTYHGDLCEGPSPFEPLSRRQGEARFSCSICGRSYTRKINLQGHERTHFGVKPYACSQCGKAFTRINDCRRHEQNHARRGA